MPPLVTIGIPTHQPGRLPYLREAMASARAQTHPAVEVLLSLNGDAEPNWRFGQEQAAADPRVRCQRNAGHPGLAGNLNALVDGARGEWLLILGDDDRLLPSAVAQLLELAAPALDVLFANHHLIDPQGRRLVEAGVAHTAAYHRDRLPPGVLADAEGWVWRGAVPLPSALVRLEALRRLRFREDLNTPELEFFLRLARAGGGFAFRPDYLAEYRVHPGSATAGGLWGERLADCLLPLAVSAGVEPFKRACLAQVLPGAVTRCLALGEHARARRYLADAYYPRSGPGGVVRCTQRFCAALPAALGGPLFRGLLRLRHKGLVAVAPAG